MKLVWRDYCSIRKQSVWMCVCLNSFTSVFCCPYSIIIPKSLLWVFFREHVPSFLPGIFKLMLTSQLYTTIFPNRYLSSFISWLKEQRINGMKIVEAESNRWSQIKSIFSKHIQKKKKSTKSWIHRLIEQPRLEETLNDHLVQPSESQWDGYFDGCMWSTRHWCW